jgi:uncharacterized protein (DUF1684 family)
MYPLLATDMYLELVDWRRRVSELFAELRGRAPDADTLAWFRGQKDALFREQAQSPIPEAERQMFAGLRYWPFDPMARVTAHFTPTESPIEAPPPSPSHDELSFTRIGHLDFELQGQPLRLGALWIEGYANGLFVPFTDQTSGRQTYGGGRYLLDTAKSADLGSDPAASTVVLDFNYAYHPSCTYDPQWVCPLAPPDNRLAVAIQAGERLL